MGTPYTFAHWIERQASERDRSQDPLGPARGFLVGTALSAAFWISLAATLA